MAKATKNVIPATYTVALTLSTDEAEALLAVLGKVGGSPQNSRRKYIQAIYETLLTLNLNYRETGAPDMVATDHVTFTDILGIR
jgi:hypothetical protein